VLKYNAISFTDSVEILNIKYYPIVEINMWKIEVMEVNFEMWIIRNIYFIFNEIVSFFCGHIIPLRFVSVG